MNSFFLALKAEFLKIRHANVIWVTFAAFAIAPVMGGVFILILQNPEALEKASLLNTKAAALDFTADWRSYLSLLTQAVGVGGIIVFGFVASWIFGREYSDGTAKDLLALPVSRTKIIHGKFLVYGLWCFALAISNLLVGVLIGLALQIESSGQFAILGFLASYLLTTLMTCALTTPVALLALWGRGYLAPLGFVVFVLVIAQIVGATGVGYYFPWSVPGLYSGVGGEYKEQLNMWSYVISFLTSLAGYWGTIFYWEKSDQAR